ncbi:MAG: hypothetical protein IPM20_14220 [Gammaproteobacteria bacterium]|nr:hypothetical protein [Gammaproteobacteria bacterium]
MTRGLEDAGPKERLQRISRHFLDEGPAPARIAVLGIAGDADALPVHGLARALAARGVPVAVADTTASLLELVYRDPGMSSTVEEALPETGTEDMLARLRRGPRPDLMLVTAPPTDAQPCALVLLGVPLQARGMRSAYLMLKALAQLAPIPVIGATLTGARTRDEASVGFTRFASAARRFLGIDLVSYSYLAAGRSRGEDEASLNDIARLLLADLRSTNASDPAARPPHQEAPWVCG